jgi:endonuclease/exonuclease/phosphatase family metal-dependent hydrolase
MTHENEVRRRTLLTACLAIPFLLLLLLGGAGEAPKAAPPQRDPRTLRVMTFNIHIGVGMDKQRDLARIANVIKAADVDVVALQEVDVRTRRSGTDVDQLAELAKLTGMHGRFGKGRDFDGGEYGQAILSRRPIKDLVVHKLPGDSVQEERVALFATIEQPAPLPELLFVGTHIHHVGENYRLPQAREINRLLKDAMSKPTPAVLLLGDLNAKPDGQVMTLMRELWEDPTADAGMTFPADKPDRKIDYVLLPKGHKWTVVSAKVVDEPVASDHRPVVVELQWKQ